ncbi:hypothetical protein Ddc_14668 [Ditylenchus destructor]|nr:hypothetical protein Ddc_14668 [Ditylenchus destructor]
MKTLGDDRRFICCCGNCHVERGVNILAKVGLGFIVKGLCLAAIVLIFWSGSFKMELSDSGAVIMLVLSIVACSAILWAQKYRKPVFYWIFISLEILFTVIGIASLLAVFVFHHHPTSVIMSLSHSNRLLKKMEKEQGVIFALEVAAFVAIYLLMLYLVWAVYRAYQYMKLNNEGKTPTVHKV